MINDQDAPSSLFILVCSIVCTYQKTLKYIPFTPLWGPRHHQRDDHCHHHRSEGGQWEHLFPRWGSLHWRIYGGGKYFLSISILIIVFIYLTHSIVRYVVVVNTHSMLMVTSMILTILSCLHFKITLAGS